MQFAAKIRNISDMSKFFRFLTLRKRLHALQFVFPSSWEEGPGVEEKNSSTYYKEVGTGFIHPTPGPSPYRGGEYLRERHLPL